MEYIITAATGFIYTIIRNNNKNKQEEKKKKKNQNNNIWIQQFITFLKQNNIKCIVFDMDHTMSACHCGAGLPKNELGKYIHAVSADFIALASALALEPNFHLAVATGSDPFEYSLPNQSKHSHILGPDLAKALINQTCPKYVLHKFQIMVGYDYRLHGKIANEKGKRHHMRKISKFYNNIPFNEMIIIDDSISSLKNEDGWHGMLVHDRTIGLTRFDIEKYTNTFGSGIEQLEYVIDGVLKHCAWTSQTKVNEMISFTESEILEVKEEMAARIINEEDLEEELGDLMFDVLLLMKICQRDFNGRVSYDRALKRCAKKIKDRCPHVFGRETANTKEEAHVIWNRVKKEQKLRKKKKNIVKKNIKEII